MPYGSRVCGFVSLLSLWGAAGWAQLRLVPGTEANADAPYIVQAEGVGDRAQARFVDGEGLLVYGFRTAGLSRLRLDLRLANNFRVWVSGDRKAWREVLNAMALHGRDRHDGEVNPYQVDLSDLLPADTAYVRFGDASPDDGWGAYVAEVTLTGDGAADHGWRTPPPPPPPGTITEWLVLGAFAADRDDLLAVPPELGDPERLGPPADGVWRLARATRGRLDLRARELALAPAENALAFAHVFVRLPSETDALLLAGSDDALAVWANGALVWRHQVLRGCRTDDDTVPLCLGRGWNRLLLAVGNGGAAWEFTARLVGMDGEPLANAVVQAEPPAELHGELPAPILPPRLALQSARVSPEDAELKDGCLRIPLQMVLTNRGGKGETPLDLVLRHGDREVRRWTLGPASRGQRTEALPLDPADWRVLAEASAPVSLRVGDQDVAIACPPLPRLLAEAGDAIASTHPEEARILQRFGLAWRQWRKTRTPAPLWRAEPVRWLGLAQEGKWQELAEATHGFAETESSPWSTSVQCAAPAGAAYDVAPDAVMVYGGADPAPRLHQWRRRGARVQIMTGIAWGDYQDYQDGRHDGKRHDDEIQTQKNGEKIGHGGDVYYWVPTVSYGDYLCQRLAPALDLPADGVCLEEPEFWMRGGWSPAFQREWAAYFGEPWQPPDSSPEARYRAWQLRRALYTRCLKQVSGFLKERRPDWECIVATHSLINYTSWGIASPESALGGIESCDSVIAQVWNDTILTPCTYDGRRAARPFATAYLEFAQMAGMIGPTGRSLVFLADPVADNARRSWKICRRRYEDTVVAGLFQGSADRFELMPWPNRVFAGSRIDGGNDDEPVTMPSGYRTSLLAVCEALRNLPPGTETASPVAVAVSDSMQAQAGFGDASGSADFFGQALPLVMRGLQPRVVHLEQAANPGVLAGVRILLLSYNGQTPPDEGCHAALARWIRDGGVLLSLTDPDDPFQRVREWWNRPPENKRLPQQHLYAALGLGTAPAEGWHAVDRGHVLIRRVAPRRFAEKDRHQELATWLGEAGVRGGVAMETRPFCTVRRGPYLAAAVLDESPDPAPLTLSGTYVDLLSDDLALVRDPALAPGRCGLWVDLERTPAAPCVLASAARIDGWNAGREGIDFVSFAPTGGAVVVWLRLEREPRSLAVTSHNGVPVPVRSEWNAENRCLRIRYPASPDGTWVHLAP